MVNIKSKIMTYLQIFRSSGSTIHQIHINLFIFDAHSFTSQPDKSARSWQIHTMNFNRTHFDKFFKDFLKIFKAQVDHWVVGRKVRKIMPVFRWQNLFEDGRGFKVRLSVNCGWNCQILSKNDHASFWSRVTTELRSCHVSLGERICIWLNILLMVGKIFLMNMY